MAKKEKIVYAGFFVNQEALKTAIEPVLTRRELERAIVAPHVTTEFKPEVVRPELLGQSVLIHIKGYGCDGRNEGLLVEVVTTKKELAAEARKKECPHITLSLSGDGKAVDTAKIPFNPIYDSVYVSGTYGLYTSKGRAILSREEYEKIAC